jgi:hypothetical protein
MNDENDNNELSISTGLIRHLDGTFGVYVLVSVPGREGGEPAQQVLTDDSGGPASFATEKEARIGAFDWLQDIRRYAMDNPPPGFSGFSEGRIEET